MSQQVTKLREERDAIGDAYVRLMEERDQLRAEIERLRQENETLRAQLDHCIRLAISHPTEGGADVPVPDSGYRSDDEQKADDE